MATNEDLLHQVMQNIEDLYQRFATAAQDESLGMFEGYSANDVATMIDGLRKVTIDGREETLLYDRDKGDVYHLTNTELGEWRKV